MQWNAKNVILTVELWNILTGRETSFTRKKGAGKKLDAKYTGPYIIVKCLSPSVYKVQGKSLTFVVHHDRLKAYVSEKLPSWILSIQKHLKE